MNIKHLHPKFKLNRLSHTAQTLKQSALTMAEGSLTHEKAIGKFLAAWLNDSDTIEVHTSGSTGIPKQITLKKQQMCNSAVATGQYFSLQPGHSALLCLSADYIAGKMMLVRAMVLGLELDVVTPSSNPLEAIEKQYHFCAMVPLQVATSIDHLDKIEQLIVGGASVSFALKQKLKGLPCKAYETYGMTETITHVAVKQLNQFNSSNTITLSNQFKALPEVFFSLDERHCLRISAPKVATEEIKTNDVVRLHSSTEFEWLGRFDNVINSGGVKIHPEQIEAKLNTLITSRFFVTGIPDEQLGQQLVLVVEGSGNSNTILNTIKKVGILSKFEMPKKGYFLLNFKETKTGKINRQQNIALLPNALN